MKKIHDKYRITVAIVLQFPYLGKNYLDENAESSCMNRPKFNNCLLNFQNLLPS